MDKSTAENLTDLEGHIEKMKDLAVEAVQLRIVARWEGLTPADLKTWGRRVLIRVSKITWTINKIKEKLERETAFDNEAVNKLLQGPDGETLSRILFILSNKEWDCHKEGHIRLLEDFGRRLFFDVSYNKMHGKECDVKDCQYRKTCKFWSPSEKGKVIKIK